MANTKLIKKRIKTAKNIHQITRAMQMVAASKMRKAQMQAISSRPYSQSLRRILLSLLASATKINHRLMKPNHSLNIAFLVITTDKGLCGGLNTNHFRYLKNYCEQIRSVNLDAAAAAARDHLQPDNLVTLVMGPAARCADALRELGPLKILDEI